jgi:DNA-binding NarL/FixJ family response regulator
MIRVAIVYEEWNLLKEIEQILSAHAEMELVDIYHDQKSLSAAQAEIKADVLLMDLDDRKQNRLAWMDAAIRKNPSLLTLVFTHLCEDQIIFEALRSGAYGFLLKEDISEKLIESIHQLKQGGAPMSPSIARKVIQSFWKNKLYAEVDYLSFREREVLNLISGGYTYHEIADSAGISPHTVHSHIKNIYSKLQVDGRKEALKKASFLGLLDTPNIPRSAD